MRLPGTKLGATGAAMRPFIAGHWKALAGAGVCSLFVALAELAKPWPIALVIDELFAGHDGAFSLEASDLRLLAGIAVLVVAIAAVDAISTYFSDLWLQRAGERIVHDLRTAAVRAPAATVARLSPAAPEGRPGDPGDGRRERCGLDVLGLARADGPGGDAPGRDRDRVDRGRPGAGPGVVRGHPRARRAQLSLPPPAAHGGPRPAQPRGRDRLHRGRGALGDGRGEGVRLRGLRAPAGRAPERDADGPRDAARPPAGPVRRGGERRDGDRDGAGGGRRRLQGLVRGALARRSGRLRDLRAQAQQPAQGHRARVAARPRRRWRAPTRSPSCSPPTRSSRSGRARTAARGHAARSRSTTSRSRTPRTAQPYTGSRCGSSPGRGSHWSGPRARASRR